MALNFKYVDGVFLCKPTFNDRHICKQADWRFDSSLKCYYTKNLGHAARLMSYMNEGEKNFLKSHLIQTDQWHGQHGLYFPDGTINHAALGIENTKLKLKPHQPDAIRFILERNRTYLAAAAGSGKTIIAAMVINCWLSKKENKDHVAIYICPAFLQLNVLNELQAWCPLYNTALIDSADYMLQENNIVIVPDSLLINGQMIYLITEKLKAKTAVLFIDEAHRYKNTASGRSKALLGVENGDGAVKPDEKFVDVNNVRGLLKHTNVVKYCFMSGTPMPNGRPLELWPIIEHSAWECVGFMPFKDYGMKYCAGYFDKEKGVMNYMGASNVRELAKRLMPPDGNFMYKIKKSVLKLPPKVNRLLIVGDKMNVKLAGLDNRLLREVSVEDFLKKQIASKKGVDEDSLHIAEYRRLLGIEKAKFSAPIIKDRLEVGGERILIFCLHTEVIDYLAEKLKKYRPIVIDGRVSDHAEKFALAKAFQDAKGKRPLIGQMAACALGFNLTCANTVDIVEPSYVPGDNDQVGDRAHRIGQNESVVVNYHVLKDSYDRNVIESLLKKQGAINDL